jgi:lipoprotein-anchoring transpeptidase ErfK/SrfK
VLGHPVDIGNAKEAPLLFVAPIRANRIWRRIGNTGKASSVAALTGWNLVQQERKIMIKRRKFLATGVALGATTLAAPALAHKVGEEYVLPEEYMPREIALETPLPPGEVHIDPNQFALFWTLPNNRARRYTVGIGRGNLYHPGTFYVGAKKKWPEWKPTPDMMKRSPNAYKNFVEGAVYENGMPGGINNPLGARALYLFTPERGDTYLRIHGTNDPRTIGVAVSNGCARLVNPQVEELYDLVPMNTKVVLYEKANAGPAHS